MHTHAAAAFDAAPNAAHMAHLSGLLIWDGREEEAEPEPEPDRHDRNAATTLLGHWERKTDSNAYTVNLD